MAKSKPVETTDSVAHAATPDGPVESAPETVTSGYSGSGPLSDLLRSGPRKVAPGESRSEREARARLAERQSVDAEAGREVFNMIVAESGDKGEWIEFEVADEAAAKKIRRIVNAAATESEHNVQVTIESWLEDRETVLESGEVKVQEVTLWAVQARRMRHTGAGRKSTKS